jgi:hypothetical protein
MPEEFHYDAWMDVQGEQQARCAMAQVVKTNVGELSLS